MIALQLYLTFSLFFIDQCVSVCRCLEEILESGYSRLPVFAEGNRNLLLGFLLVKELIVVGIWRRRLSSAAPLPVICECTFVIGLSTADSTR